LKKKVAVFDVPEDSAHVSTASYPVKNVEDFQL
jgi:hypothetical protein